MLNPKELVELRALSERPKQRVRAKWVAEARESTGLNKTETANLLKVGRRTWLQWEKGERQMPQRDYEFFVLLTQCPQARAHLMKIRARG